MSFQPYRYWHGITPAGLFGLVTVPTFISDFRIVPISRNGISLSLNSCLSRVPLYSRASKNWLSGLFLISYFCFLLCCGCVLLCLFFFFLFQYSNGLSLCYFWWRIKSRTLSGNVEIDLELCTPNLFPPSKSHPADAENLLNRIRSHKWDSAGY